MAGITSSKHLPEKKQTVRAPHGQEFNKHRRKNEATIGALPVNTTQHLKGKY